VGHTVFQTNTERYQMNMTAAHAKLSRLGNSNHISMNACVGRDTKTIVSDQ
jgi:hypothetical protein